MPKSKKKPDQEKDRPGKADPKSEKKKKPAAPKKEKGPSTDSSASAKKFLCGCALPVFFLVLIFGLFLYFAGAPVIAARMPSALPDFLFYPVNQVSVWAPWYYDIYERIYAAAGGNEDPFERGCRWNEFRAVQRGNPPIHWVIHEDHAEITSPAHLRRNIPYGAGGRSLFLQQFRTNGDYKDCDPIETVTTYRAGMPVRIRRGPLNNGCWMFDCTIVPVRERVMPFTGWVLKKRQDDWVSELYLTGKKIMERRFMMGVYNAEYSENPLFQYQYTRDQNTMFQLFENELKRREKISDDLLWGRDPRYSPDTLMTMAVRKSDLPLLTLLLRKKETVKEMNSQLSMDAFSLLHEAAIQPEPRVLEKLLPFFHSTQLREKLTGATPFLAAVSADRADNVLLFLRREDCRINDTLNDGRTALHLAVENGSSAMVTYLLHHGAAKNLKDKKRRTPMQLLKEKLQMNPSDPELHIIREILE